MLHDASSSNLSPGVQYGSGLRLRATTRRGGWRATGVEHGRELRHGDRAKDLERRPALEGSGAVESLANSPPNVLELTSVTVGPMMRENVVESYSSVPGDAGV